MFQKLNLALLLYLFPVSIISGQSCLCDPQDGEGTFTWYSVSAPSGLSLREGPNRNTAKLDVVPFGEEVLACAVTNFTETIEGKYGHWIKVTWADKTGYLFGGFLTMIAERNVQMVIPNSGVDSEWGSMELSPEIKWEALVNLDTGSRSSQHIKPMRFASVGLTIGKKKATEDDVPARFLNHAVLNLSRAPFAIFSGFKLANSVVNQVPAPIKLLPGEVVNFSTYDQVHRIERRYLIAVEGNTVLNPNLTQGGYNAPISSIEHYKINLYQQALDPTNSDQKMPWSIQKLFDGTIKKPGDADTPELDVFYIYFAGDLDGDHQLDLILARLNGTGRAFQLYLSSKKLPGFLLRYVAMWADSGC